MTRFKALAVLSVSITVGLLLSPLTRAGDSTGRKSTEDKNKAPDIQPGMKCVLTADLKCEIHEVNKDAVLIKVKAIREASRGVPMLGKVPHTNRLFRNAGVGRSETNVILSIPKDRIKHIGARHDKADTKQNHVQKQVEALRKRIAHLQVELKRLETTQARQLARGQRQIMVQFQVLEVPLEKLRKSGFNIHESDLGGRLGNSSRPRQGLRESIVSGPLDQDARFLRMIERLRKAGLVKILAEPTLVTLSGRPASFHSGGEFPVSIPRGDGKVAVKLRECGTRVDLVARYLGNERLRLEIRLAISEADASRSVRVGDMDVPGLRVRSVDTAVELESGQTLVMSGLIQAAKSEAATDENGGQQASDQTELILLATPTLVESTPHAPASLEHHSNPAVRRVKSAAQPAVRY